jgi:hypothetical protein
MAPSFENPPLQRSFDTQQISSLAAEACKEVETDKQLAENTAHTEGWCRQVSPKLCEKLNTQGLKASVAHSNGEGTGISEHEFVVIHDEVDPTIVDATWQQLLDEPDPKLPAVLICRRSELSKILASYGIPASRHSLWLGANIQQQRSNVISVDFVGEKRRKLNNWAKPARLAA